MELFFGGLIIIICVLVYGCKFCILAILNAECGHIIAVIKYIWGIYYGKNKVTTITSYFIS